MNTLYTLVVCELNYLCASHNAYIPTYGEHSRNQLESAGNQKAER